MAHVCATLIRRVILYQNVGWYTGALQHSFGKNLLGKCGFMHISINYIGLAIIEHV